MGLDTSSTSNFWQVRAAVELNTAVLYSFRSAGVRIEEPKAESDLFAEFARREEVRRPHRARRLVLDQRPPRLGVRRVLAPLLRRRRAQPQLLARRSVTRSTGLHT